MLALFSGIIFFVSFHRIGFADSLVWSLKYVSRIVSINIIQLLQLIKPALIQMNHLRTIRRGSLRISLQLSAWISYSALGSLIFRGYSVFKGHFLLFSLDLFLVPSRERRTPLYGPFSVVSSKNFSKINSIFW